MYIEKGMELLSSSRAVENSFRRQSNTSKDPPKMKTLCIDRDVDQDDLCKVNKLISKSRKIVTLTGAGISCNAGIPDFRSNEGLYNMVKRQHPDCVVRGKDLFDISLFREEKTLKVFCTFMESLYSQTLFARPTQTHKFIQNLSLRKKLIKCYTQNIDGLERHLGMATGVVGNWKELDVVQLHGDLNSLGCTQCFTKYDWTPEFQQEIKEGQFPDCPLCTENFFSRINNGKRMSSSTVGFLKPNIVLYGENHPHLENIAKGLSQDMNKNPQLLIIMGTSLKVDGVKRLVREMAKKIHLRDGLVIFVNKQPVAQASWDKIIDYHIQADCDDWCNFLESKVPKLFEELMITPPTTPTKVKSTSLQPLVAPPAKPDFEIYYDAYSTPELSPCKENKSPRKINISEKTLQDITNITTPTEEPSPLFSPIKKMPTLKRSRSELDQTLVEKRQTRSCKVAV